MGNNTNWPKFARDLLVAAGVPLTAWAIFADQILQHPWRALALTPVYEALLPAVVVALVRRRRPADVAGQRT